MFINLRAGSQLYILHKSVATPYIEVGVIDNISNALPYMGYAAMALPVDITVHVGDKVVTYQRLPANADAADVTEKSSNEAVTIACTKDAISQEVQAMQQKSLSIISSIDYHKNIVDVCNKMLTQLNPEQAERDAQQQEMIQLKSKFDAMAASMQQLMEQNKELMHQLKDAKTAKVAKQKED